MLERDKKKEDGVISIQKPPESGGKLIEQQQNFEDKAQEDIHGSFVVKNSSAERVKSILHRVDMEQLIIEYPFLGASKNLKKLKEPLLAISEHAEQGIKEHISWGIRTKENINEQGGILIGNPFLIDGSILGVVEYVIPAEVSRSSAAYLEMGTETWAKMLNIYDEQYKEKGLFVIGWFHTHPNELPVFMSSTDMGTQQAFFNQDWHFSIVLNPHKRLIACFYSGKAEKCDFYPTNFADRQVGYYGE